MIDVEKMQKVNRLAQELMSHGMAGDMDDAFQQANGLINKEQGTLSLSPQSPQQHLHQSSHQASSPSASAPQQEESNWFFAMQRLNKQLELQARTIEELKATISSLQSDVLTVKSMQNMRAMQATSVQQAPVSSVASAPSASALSSPSFSHEEQAAPKVASVKSNYNRPQLAERGSGSPRCGVFTSDDVSIEKFFYSGPGGGKIR